MTISRHSTSPSAPSLVAGPVTPPAPSPAPRERTHPPAEQQDDRTALREERLAEMVAELTGCAPAGALEAVRANTGKDDPLETVARAMIAVEDPDNRFRVTGYLRPRPQGRRAARRPGGEPVAGPRPHPSVVAPLDEAPAEAQAEAHTQAEVTMSTSGPDRLDDGLDAWCDDVVLDLRHDRPEVRIDLTMVERIARVRREHRRP